MTAAAFKKSNTKTIYSQGGLFEDRILRTPSDIEEHVTRITSGGDWSPKYPLARETQAAYLALADRCKITGSVSSSDVDEMMSKDAFTWLVTDHLIGRVNGAYMLLAPGDRNEVEFPGWDGGNPKGIPHAGIAVQRELILIIHERIIAKGLPAGLFPDYVEDEFRKALKRDGVVLPAWCWAALMNRDPAMKGWHPVSRKTASRRLTELSDLGLLVMTRASRTVFDPQANNFRTTPAAYATPRPGLVGIIRKIRARRERKQEDTEQRQASDPLWRLQHIRWEWRRREAGFW